MTESPSYPKLVQVISALGADLVMDMPRVDTCFLLLSTRKQYKTLKRVVIQ